MEEQTEQHLAVARTNRRVATEYFTFATSQFATLPAPAIEWTVVIAFYSAVHYVNAYIWETLGREPANHGQRKAIVFADRRLERIAPTYADLQAQSMLIRYGRTFHLSPERIQEALDGLWEIAIVISDALDAEP